MNEEGAPFYERPRNRTEQMFGCIALAAVVLGGMVFLIASAESNSEGRGPDRPHRVRQWNKGSGPVTLEFHSYRDNSFEYCFDVVLTNTSDDDVGDVVLIIDGLYHLWIKDATSWKSSRSRSQGSSDLRAREQLEIMFNWGEDYPLAIDPDNNRHLSKALSEPTWRLPRSITVKSASGNWRWEINPEPMDPSAP